MKRLAPIALAVLLLPVSLRGQQSQGAMAPRDTTMTSFRWISGHFGGLLQASFEAIPADRYAFRPTPPQQSVGYIAQHLEVANYSLCDRFGALKHTTVTILERQDSLNAWPKDSLTRRLRASFAFCDSALAQLHDAALTTRVAYGPVGATATALPSRSLLLFVTDLAEHYSQLASYMRVMGLVPPSAQQAREHTAIELPASVLASYTGTYDLPPSALQDSPGLVLVVEMKEGALFLKPGPRPARRIWPESMTDFFVREVDAQVRFIADANGTVSALMVRQNGEDRRAVKVR